jgi:hypothetical protein
MKSWSLTFATQMLFRRSGSELFDTLKYYSPQNIPTVKYLLMKISYLLTPWSRAPIGKLPGSVASQEIPHIFGTRRFHTVPFGFRKLLRKLK